jgi:hypothetical protein
MLFADDILTLHIDGNLSQINLLTQKITIKQSLSQSLKHNILRRDPYKHIGLSLNDLWPQIKGQAKMSTLIVKYFDPIPKNYSYCFLFSEFISNIGLPASSLSINL